MPILPAILMAFLLSNTKSNPGLPQNSYVLDSAPDMQGHRFQFRQGTKIPQYCVAWLKTKTLKNFNLGSHRETY